MVLGKSSREECILPVGCSDEEKALGMYWNTVADQFYVKLELSAEEKSILLGLFSHCSQSQSQEEESGCRSLKSKLTLRLSLSFHSRIFDPLGLMLPTRMIGMLLFLESIQFLKKGLEGRIPWDEHLDGELLQRLGSYFQMVMRLEEIKFPRSFKPDCVDANIDPDLVTFSDGNPHAFGTVAWTLEDGSRQSRLVGSKAKLAQLL